MCSYPRELVAFEVPEEYPVSNVDVGELEERLLDVRHWDLHGKMKGWIDQILQVEPPAIQGHGPYMQACSGLGRQGLVASQIDIVGLLYLRQYGLTLPKP